MPMIHTVRQGECLSSIARQYGFMSWRSLYEHPENEKFRSLRKSPNIISPGDRLVIPDPSVKSIGAQTDELHRYRVKGEPTYLRLNLLSDVYGEGSVGKYVLEVEGMKEPLEGELGEKGAIDVPVLPQSNSAKLSLFDSSSGQCIHTVELRIGDLDPIETISGVQARLNALRFDCGKVDDIWGEVTERAVRRFQKSLDIVDEKNPYGQITMDKLVELYGS
ncbi:MAG: peptidoglycan-binding protein [Candidatus Thiodiazotropha sp.]